MDMEQALREALRANGARLVPETGDWGSPSIPDIANSIVVRLGDLRALDVDELARAWLARDKDHAMRAGVPQTTIDSWTLDHYLREARMIAPHYRGSDPASDGRRTAPLDAGRLVAAMNGRIEAHDLLLGHDLMPAAERIADAHNAALPAECGASITDHDHAYHCTLSPNHGDPLTHG